MPNSASTGAPRHSSGTLAMTDAQQSTDETPTLSADHRSLLEAVCKTRITRTAPLSEGDCQLSVGIHTMNMFNTDAPVDTVSANPAGGGPLTPADVARRRYLARAGDLAAMLDSADGHRLASAVAEYVHALERIPHSVKLDEEHPLEEPTPFDALCVSSQQCDTRYNSWIRQRSRATLAAILFADPRRPCESTTSSDAARPSLPIERNPACTDCSPLQLPRVDPTHSRNSLTVAMGVTPARALYAATGRRCGSLRADLKVAFGGNDAVIGAIVDSGASWTAIRASELDKLGAGPLFKSHMRFHGVSGAPLRCRGWVVLTITMGPVTFSTKAFVFDALAEPMLLGANTLCNRGLTIDAANMALYHGARADLPADAIPLYGGPEPVADATAESDAIFFVNADRSRLYCRDPRSTAVGAVTCAKSSERRRRRRRRGGVRGESDSEPGSDGETDDALGGGSHIGQPTSGGGETEDPSLHETAARRKTLLEGANLLREMQRLPRDDAGDATVMVATDTVIPAKETVSMLLWIQEDIPGPNRSLEITPSRAFNKVFPELCGPTELTAVHQSASKAAFCKVRNFSDRTVRISGGTPYGSACIFEEPDAESFLLECHPEAADLLLGTTNVESEGVGDSSDDPPDQHVREGEDNPDVTHVEFEGIGPAVVEFEVPEEGDYHKRPFDDNGSCKTREDLEAIGLDFSMSHNLGAEGQPLLTDEELQPLVDVCLRNEMVFARNAKVPYPARHPLTRVEINTGTAAPIRQKPYPIPERYLPAVRAEIDRLLKAGLIEPGFSDWCSPVLVILKKDSEKGALGTDIKLKIACDYRRLNASTIVDAALLGDQADVLESFNQRPYVSLCDAAGGFYQFLIKPEDRPKTCFILPSSCGGTLFQWKVAPYGLTNMPAIYSRAMQHVLQGLVDVDLGYLVGANGELDPDGGYLGDGTAPTWVDDITIASGRASAKLGVRGHCELLDRVFRRLILAGISLKPSKCHLLRKCLEVLGFIVTREGLQPNPEKVRALADMPERLHSPAEVLRFLGMVNFNRRFIPRLAEIADPLYASLKGFKNSDLKASRHPARSKSGSRPFIWTEDCQRAYDQLKTALSEDCLTHHPDFRDPNAELVLMTDASTVAAGAVLFQWQRDSGTDERPAAPPMETYEGDDFASTLQKRVSTGYTLRVLGYYSKTFNDTQRNWAIFDKEAASIILALNHWHRLIAGRPTTVYTDNTVAASMMTNHKMPRPPRLQRWGVIIGSYMPFLRVAYRKGEHNEVADELSRYPTNFEYHCKHARETPNPDDLYDRIASFDWGSRRYTLLEAHSDELADVIWESLAEEDQAALAAENGRLNSLLAAFQAAMDDVEPDFAAEREVAEHHQQHWGQYSRIFRAQFGRAPIVYDFFSGEGGYARGAAAAGCTVVSFDIRARPTPYGQRAGERTLSGRFERTPVDGMHYVQADLSKDAFWDDMRRLGRVQGHPPPDLMHASPPCAPHSRLRHLPRPGKAQGSLVSYTLSQLQRMQDACRTAAVPRYVPWTLENTTEARSLVPDQQVSAHLLCGTMFGHRVFRHRLILSDAPLSIELQCDHRGKSVGTRGLNRVGLPGNPDAPAGPSNMFGPYSRRDPKRGSLDEILDAMGYEPGAFTYAGVTQALPAGYGRYLAGQLVARALAHNVGVPYVTFEQTETEPLHKELLYQWTLPAEGLCGALLSLDETTAVRLLQRSWRALTGRTPQAESEAARVIQRYARQCFPHRGGGPAGRRHRHGQRAARGPLRPTPFPPIVATETDWESMWALSLEDQLSDPALRSVCESLQADESQWLRWKAPRRRLGLRHRREYVLRDQLFALTPQGRRLVVPGSKQYDLLSVYHRNLDVGGHRGALPLYHHIARHYYWEGLLADCETLVQHCEVCQSRDTTHMPQVRPTMMVEPPHPFHTLYIDYKILPRSVESRYSAVLVVTDGLTRFTLAIPVESQTAEVTMRALVDHVFTTFSMPMVVRSDNGPEFRNALSAEFAKYAGYRHVHVLPYNAPANGAAEQAAKRVQSLLVKHCRLLADWHRSLPMVCFALNTTVHRSMEVSPFFALFGRHPITIPELEEPSNYRPTLTGSDFLRGTAERLRSAWESVRAASSDIKQAVIERGARHRRRWAAAPAADSIAGIHVGEWVLLRHGSEQHAKVRKKHGYPAFRRFRVLRLIPEANAIEIDTRGTPIQPVVSVRQCKRAPDAWWLFDDASPASGVYEGPLTLKVANGNPNEVGGRLIDGVDDVDCDTRAAGVIYPVEWVLEAERVRQRWYYRILWVGYPEATWEPEITLEDAGEQVQGWMADARERYMDNLRKGEGAGQTNAADALRLFDDEGTFEDPRLEADELNLPEDGNPEDSPQPGYWARQSSRRPPVRRLVGSLTATAASRNRHVQYFYEMYSWMVTDDYHQL